MNTSSRKNTWQVGMNVKVMLIFFYTLRDLHHEYATQSQTVLLEGLRHLHNIMQVKCSADSGNFAVAL